MYCIIINKRLFRDLLNLSIYLIVLFAIGSGREMNQNIVDPKQNREKYMVAIQKSSVLKYDKEEAWIHNSNKHYITWNKCIRFV